jgi:hypothetical protein
VRACILALFPLTAAFAEPPPRDFTWAGAVEQLPALAQYTPAASAKALTQFAPKFAKVGGTCVALKHDGPTILGQGNQNGHTWRWELNVTLINNTVTIIGPHAIHGLDRVGDGRVFRDEPKPRTLVAGYPSQTHLPLYAQQHTLEIACWGDDTNTVTCKDGKKEVCHRCTVLRILGGPLGGQKVIGDGVIHADLTRECGDPCRGQGMRWVDFESLASTVKKTPVVVTAEAPVAALFVSKQACMEASEATDLAKDFRPTEPAIPAR